MASLFTCCDMTCLLILMMSRTMTDVSGFQSCRIGGGGGDQIPSIIGDEFVIDCLVAIFSSSAINWC